MVQIYFGDFPPRPKRVYYATATMPGFNPCDALIKYKRHKYNPLGTQAHLPEDKSKQKLPNSEEP